MSHRHTIYYHSTNKFSLFRTETIHAHYVFMLVTCVIGVITFINIIHSTIVYLAHSSTQLQGMCRLTSDDSFFH